VCQVFPHDGHPMEGLEVTLVLENGKTWYQERTSLTLCESPPGYDLTRLTRTLEPSRVPSHARPEVEGRLMSRREPESIHDFGSNSVTPHIFPSSCRDSWKARLAGLEISTRTCANSERMVEMKLWFGDSRCPGIRRATPNSRFAGSENRFDTRPHEGSC